MQQGQPDDKPKASGSSQRTSGLTTRVVKSSLWTLAGQIAPLAASFVATPLLLRLIGSEGYGVIALIILIPQYLICADLGMVIASTRFAADSYSRGDRKGEADVIATSAMLTMAGAAIPFVLVLIFARDIAYYLGVPPHYMEAGTWAIRITSGTFVVTLLGQILNSPLLARLRMDLTSSVQALSRIAGIFGTLAAIYFGYGIGGAALALFAAAFLNFAGLYWFSYKKLPEIKGARPRRPVARELFRFGFSMALANLAAVAIVNIEKFVLSSFASVVALAHYTVAFALAGIVVFFSTAMMQSLVPTFSQLQGEDSKEVLASLYSRSIKLMMLCLAPFLLVLGIAAKPFFTLWAGPEFGVESSVLLYILLAGLSFNLLAYAPTAAIIAFGRSDILARLYWIELIPYAALAVLLVMRFGAVGAAVAWSIRAIVDTVAQFAIVSRTTGIGLRRDTTILIPLYLSMLFPFLIYFVTEPGIAVSAAIAVVSLSVYALVCWKFILGEDELRWVSGLLRKRFQI